MKTLSLYSLVLFSFTLSSCSSFTKGSQNTDDKKEQKKVTESDRKAPSKPKKHYYSETSQSSATSGITYSGSLDSDVPDLLNTGAPTYSSYGSANDTGIYPGLEDADDPATDQQISQEATPVISAPTNIITP